jgi:Zn-dependent protease with chaperone function
VSETQGEGAARALKKKGPGRPLSLKDIYFPGEKSYGSRRMDSPEVSQAGQAASFCFSGTIQRPEISAFYRVSLVFVAAGMLILPVLYVALVAICAWATQYYARHFFGPIMDWPVGGSLGWTVKIFAYAIPVSAGAAMTLALIKPVFAPRRKKSQPLGVTRETEPRLYEFIHEICAIVGAPAPKRILLSCDVNAFAGLHLGFRSLFNRELDLTLGLPLVAALSARELAGVVAHEFGHFTQNFGLRLTFLIRSINFWFARVVYERDGWDAAIDEFASTEDWRAAIFGRLVQFGVVMARGALWLIMTLGQVISSFAQRQMEYHADLFEMRLAGSAAFESTMERFAVVGAALPGAWRKLEKSWGKSMKLPDNYPAFLMGEVRELSPATAARVINELGLSKTGWLHTHPSDGDRIRRARQAAESGICLADGPATELFENFYQSAKFVTLIHYEDELELPIDEEMLVPMTLGAKPAATPVTETVAPALQPSLPQFAPSAERPWEKTPE